MTYIKNYIINILKKKFLFFLGLIVLTLASSIIAIMLPIQFKNHLINLENNSTITILLQSFMIYFSYLLISSIVSIVWHYLITKFGAFILFDLRKHLLQKIETAYMDKVNEYSRNRLKHIIFSDSLVIFRVLVNFSIQIIAKTVVICLILTIIYLSFKRIALFLAIAMIIGIVIANYARKKIAEVSKKVNDSMKSTHSMINNHIDSIKLYQSNDLDNYKNRKYSEINNVFLKSALHADIIQVFFTSTQGNLKSIFNIVFITMLYILSDIEVTTSSVVLLIFYSNIVWSYSSSIENLISTIGESIPAFKNINSILSLESRTGSHVIKRIKEIEFSKVSFMYKDEMVVKDLSFKLEKGTCYQITGKNGSGKSTLISLLMNLNRPSEGEILINGIRLDEVDHKSYIRKITYIDQNELLLEENIVDYIQAVTQNYSVNKIRDILSSISFSNDENTDMLEKLDFMGKNISGGQRKKLLFCKLLLKFIESDLIIIDEVTANMDSQTKKAYQDIRSKMIKNTEKIFIEVNHENDISNFNNISL